jgi:hypothetical protein
VTCVNVLSVVVQVRIATRATRVVLAAAQDRYTCLTTIRFPVVIVVVQARTAIHTTRAVYAVVPAGLRRASSDCDFHQTV